jgi:hypothetical protein
MKTLNSMASNIILQSNPETKALIGLAELVFISTEMEYRFGEMPKDKEGKEQDGTAMYRFPKAHTDRVIVSASQCRGMAEDLLELADELTSAAAQWEHNGDA